MTSYDASSSGARWWVHATTVARKTGRYSCSAAVRDADSSQDNPDDEGCFQENLFHWDKDEDFENTVWRNNYVHPHVSFVTVTAIEHNSGHQLSREPFDGEYIYQARGGDDDNITRRLCEFAISGQAPEFRWSILARGTT
jgi:hypothetical protein